MPCPGPYGSCHGAKHVSPTAQSVDIWNGEATAHQETSQCQLLWLTFEPWPKLCAAGQLAKYGSFQSLLRYAGGHGGLGGSPDGGEDQQAFLRIRVYIFSQDFT